jgi:hypothetical protein
VKQKVREDKSAIIEAMRTLKRVEEIVGRVESWPTYIILNMFVCSPTEQAMKKWQHFCTGTAYRWKWQQSVTSPAEAASISRL